MTRDTWEQWAIGHVSLAYNRFLCLLGQHMGMRIWWSPYLGNKKLVLLIIRRRSRHGLDLIQENGLSLKKEEYIPKKVELLVKSEMWVFLNVSTRNEKQGKKNKEGWLEKEKEKYPMSKWNDLRNSRNDAMLAPNGLLIIPILSLHIQ